MERRYTAMKINKGMVINAVQLVLGAATLAVGFVKNQNAEKEQQQLLVDTATKTANEAVTNMFNKED
jgi:hypothetical protein